MLSARGPARYHGPEALEGTVAAGSVYFDKVRDEPDSVATIEARFKEGTKKESGSNKK